MNMAWKMTVFNTGVIDYDLLCNGAVPAYIRYGESGVSPKYVLRVRGDTGAHWFAVFGAYDTLEEAKAVAEAMQTMEAI